MKYMVMECHPGYAVVLSEDGRFMKVANRRYEIGQSVSDVIEMHMPKARTLKSVNVWIMAAAASFLLIMSSAFYSDRMAVGSVYMTINPEIRIDVNRKDVVVDVEGMNTDGTELIREYRYEKKQLDLVMDELMKLAIDKGYLHEGGAVSIVLDAEDDRWVMEHSDALTTHMNEHRQEILSVVIEINHKSITGEYSTVPIEAGDSEYGESDYGETVLPETTVPEKVVSEPAIIQETVSQDAQKQDAVQSDYYHNGQTDYDRQEDTPYEEPDTPYEEPDTPYEEPDTPYEEPDTPYEEPDTPYEEPDTPYEEPDTPYEDEDDGESSYDDSEDDGSDYDD